MCLQDQEEFESFAAAQVATGDDLDDSANKRSRLGMLKDADTQSGSRCNIGKPAVARLKDPNAYNITGSTVPASDSSSC